MTFSAIIVAAGSGSRAGGLAKQWRPLAGRAVARWSLEALLAAGAQTVCVVVSPHDREKAERAFEGLRNWTLADGGAERRDSVLSGLRALSSKTGGSPERVLIHDAARPFVSKAHVEALLKALDGADAALPCLAVSDTLKRETDESLSTVPREGLWRAQTPQAFRYAKLMEALAAWPQGEVPTDDAAVVERAGGNVARTAGDPMLMKLTYAEDFPMAEALAGQARIVRTGMGLDAHRFGPGDSVWLCGVEIAHSAALVGHSDADAGLHALTDAILGAVGEGDIGDHFPPSDPQWKGASSDRFLTHALELVRAKGGRLLNVDVTLVCERPKIKPHRQAMRERLADLLALPLDRVSVKATTTEGMGYTGREEGLMAQAIASVETPA